MNIFYKEHKLTTSLWWKAEMLTLIPKQVDRKCQALVRKARESSLGVRAVRGPSYSTCRQILWKLWTLNMLTCSRTILIFSWSAFLTSPQWQDLEGQLKATAFFISCPCFTTRQEEFKVMFKTYKGWQYNWAQVILILFLIFLLVRLWLGCIWKSTS